MQDNSAKNLSKQQLSRRLRITIIIIIMMWTLLYNIFIKNLDPITAFFHIFNTISDEFIMGSFLTISIGIGILLAFSLTKFYSQIISNIYSFRIIENILFSEFRVKNLHRFFSHVIKFQEQPTPDNPCPKKISFLLLSLAFLYAGSWVYLLIFSEALFFISWSAGVNLEFTSYNLLVLPTIALAIPFSARVMAYIQYPYVKDYADFMPGTVFVLLVVTSLGYLFESDDQKFFLIQIFSNFDYLFVFLKNGVFLAFIPVFFEAMFWFFRLETKDDNSSD